MGSYYGDVIISVPTALFLCNEAGAQQKKEDIISEVKRLAGTGYKEITFGPECQLLRE